MEFSKVYWVCTLFYLFFPLVLGDHGFKMVSKGVSTPPSLPNKKPNVPIHSPPLPQAHRINLNFKMLQKGVHVPTSGPNPKSITSPPLLAHRTHLNFQMLPKGKRVPPSEDSMRHNGVPPYHN